MSFARTNPSGWFRYDSLTADQLNDMDTNISYAVDKRDGYTENVHSDIIMQPGSSMTISDGSALYISNPENISIADGYLELDAIISGFSKPLRFGISTVSLTGLVNTKTLSFSEYKQSILVLTGTLTTNMVIYLPEFAGFTKLIRNQTTGDYKLSVNTITAGTAGDAGVYIPINKVVEVINYDGIHIREVARQPNLYVQEIKQVKDTSEYGTTFDSTFSTTYYNIAGFQIIFDNCFAGDKFEVSYNVGLQAGDNSGSAKATVQAYYLETGGSETGLDETVRINNSFYQKMVSSTTIHTLTANKSQVLFSLRLKTSSGHKAYVSAPCCFLVKRLSA